MIEVNISEPQNEARLRINGHDIGRVTELKMEPKPLHQAGAYCDPGGVDADERQMVTFTVELVPEPPRRVPWLVRAAWWLSRGFGLWLVRRRARMTVVTIDTKTPIK